SKPINCVKYSPNGLFIATGSADKTIKIWKNYSDFIHSDQSDSAFTILFGGTSSFDQTSTTSKFIDIKILNNGNFIVYFNLIEDGVSSLKIYNSNGFLIDSYGFTTSGSQTIELDSKRYNNGLYFITIETPTQFDKAKLLLVK